MNPESKINALLFNPIAQIRWQWRILIFFFFTLILSNLLSVYYALYVPAVPLTSSEHDAVTLIHFTGWLAGVSFVTWLVLRFLDKRPWRSIGLSFHPEWGRELLFGILLGLLMPVVLLALLFPWGFISVDVQPVEFIDFGRSLILNMLIWAAAAFWIELVLRGYFLQTMAEGMGKIVASVFVSLMYAVIQTQMQSDAIVNGMNIALSGFIFTICYFRTRALWTGIGIQWSLNFVQNFILGVPVLGVRSSVACLQVDVHLRNIAVGDYFGMEQGLIASLILLSCIYYLLQSKQLAISETVRKIKFEALSIPFLKSKKQP